LRPEGAGSCLTHGGRPLLLQAIAQEASLWVKSEHVTGPRESPLWLGNVVTEVDNIIALAATRSDHRLSGSFRSFDLAKSQVGPRNLADIVELLSRAGSHREALTQARCTQKACCAHAPYCG
jgi:hypothetical protein